MNLTNEVGSFNTYFIDVLTIILKQILLNGIEIPCISRGKRNSQTYFYFNVNTNRYFEVRTGAIVVLISVANGF